METASSWYWCQDHRRAEPGSEACRAEVRLGPYPSKAAAENWQATAEHRNEAWDADDRRWSGDDD